MLRAFTFLLNDGVIFGAEIYQCPLIQMTSLFVSLKRNCLILCQKVAASFPQRHMVWSGQILSSTMYNHSTEEAKCQCSGQNVAE